jgi:hypothetical protein
VERVLAEEGFSKLPRLKIGLTGKGAEVPQKTKGIAIGKMEGRYFSCESAGVFLFIPFLERVQVLVCRGPRSFRRSAIFYPFWP